MGGPPLWYGGGMGLTTAIRFNKYLEQCDAANRADPRHWSPDHRESDPGERSPTHHDLTEPDSARDDGHVEERTVFGNLFKNPYRAVNPVRRILPTKSRLLASPFRKRRLKSQVIGCGGTRPRPSRYSR